MNNPIWAEREFIVKYPSRSAGKEPQWLDTELTYVIIDSAAVQLDNDPEVMQKYDLTDTVRVLALIPYGLDGINRDNTLFVRVTNELTINGSIIKLSIISYPQPGSKLVYKPVMPDEAARTLGMLVTNLKKIPGLVPPNLGNVRQI